MNASVVIPRVHIDICYKGIPIFDMAVLTDTAKQPAWQYSCYHQLLPIAWMASGEFGLQAHVESSNPPIRNFRCGRT